MDKWNDCPITGQPVERKGKTGRLPTYASEEARRLEGALAYVETLLRKVAPTMTDKARQRMRGRLFNLCNYGAMRPPVVKP